MPLFEIKNSIDSYLNFINSKTAHWADIESEAPYIYKNIIPEYGYNPSPNLPDLSFDEVKYQTEQMIDIVHEQSARLSKLLGINEPIADVFLLPTNKSVPCLTGCFTDFQHRPLCIIGFDGFFGHLEYFKIICAHEMTHAVHMHFNHPGPTALQTGTLGQCLWNEGLAEFTSAQLNPEFPKNKVLQGALNQYSFENLKPLFNKFNNLIEVPLHEPTLPIHQKWFGMGGEDDGIMIPAAAAYIMGYRTIEKLTEQYSLVDLLKMPPKNFEPLLKELF